MVDDSFFESFQEANLMLEFHNALMMKYSQSVSLCLEAYNSAMTESLKQVSDAVDAFSIPNDFAMMQKELEQTIEDNARIAQSCISLVRSTVHDAMRSIEQASQLPWQ